MPWQPHLRLTLNRSRSLTLTLTLSLTLTLHVLSLSRTLPGSHTSAYALAAVRAVPIDESDGDEGGGGGEGEEGGAEGGGGGGGGGEEGGGGGGGGGGSGSAVPSSVELLHEISTSGDSELLVVELRSLSTAVVRYLSITP